MTATPASSKHVLTRAAHRREYGKSPLIEAVLELRVDPLPEQSLEILKRFVEDERTRYPQTEALFAGGIEVKFEATGKIPVVEGSSEQIGFILRSTDKSELVQARRNGISYHKLPPYSKWESCFAETRRLWSRFVTFLSPGAVRQLGLRYVNRLLLPAPSELKDYLRTYPEVSPDLSQVMSGYVMQISLPQPDLEGTVLVTRQALTAAPTPNAAAVLLDNDLVKKGEFKASGEELWQAFEMLHNRQNEVFEGSITDNTRELIA